MKRAMLLTLVGAFLAGCGGGGGGGGSSADTASGSGGTAVQGASYSVSLAPASEQGTAQKTIASENIKRTTARLVIIKKKTILGYDYVYNSTTKVYDKIRNPAKDTIQLEHTAAGANVTLGTTGGGNLNITIPPSTDNDPYVMYIITWSEQSGYKCLLEFAESDPFTLIPNKPINISWPTMNAEKKVVPEAITATLHSRLGATDTVDATQIASGGLFYVFVTDRSKVLSSQFYARATTDNALAGDWFAHEDADLESDVFGSSPLGITAPNVTITVKVGDNYTTAETWVQGEFFLDSVFLKPEESEEWYKWIYNVVPASSTTLIPYITITGGSL